MWQRLVVSFGMAFALGACGSDDGSGAGGGGAGGSGTGGSGATGGGITNAPSHSVSGTVVDFLTGEAVDASATLSISGVEPPPAVTVTGASFEITGIPTESVVQLLAGAPPSYQPTYDLPLEVTADVSDLSVAVVSSAFVGELEAAFGAPAGGLLLAQATDGSGAPLADVSAAAFELPNASGPFFLDGAMSPQIGASATSASGWVVFLGVGDGLVGLNAADGSGVTFLGSQVLVADGAVSILRLEVVDGEQPLPTNVSFTGDVVPIFTKRGCDNCHSGNSIGADLGDLALNGGENKVYKELTEEVSPTHGEVRVNVEDPEASLLLRLPSLEDPPDAHPTSTFASPSDPDYLMLLGWITEGAPQN